MSYVTRRPKYEVPVRTKRTFMILGVVLHLGAALNLFLAGNHLLGLSEWQGQFLVLIGINLVLSVTIPIIANISMRTAALALSLAVVIVAGYPFHQNLTFELPLGLVVVAYCGALLPFRLAIAAVAFCLVCLALTQMPLPFFGDTVFGLTLNPPPVESILIFVLVLGGVGALSVIVSRDRERAVRESRHNKRLLYAIKRLSSANVGLQQYVSVAEEESRESELARVSGEVHDTAGYTLTTVMMQIEAAVRLIPTSPDQSIDLLRRARGQAREGMDDIRVSLRRVRSRNTRRVGIPAIIRLAEVFEHATGVRVRVDPANFVRTVDVVVEAVIYRLVQEALTNAFKHGAASSVWVTFWQDAETVTVDISDDGGPTPPPDSTGIGLETMRQRVESIGGTIAFGATKHGYAIHAILPLGATDNGTDSTTAG